ncbi:hypothetical protein COY90_02400 [Candidatus Roizmanbacteria bacterium CG_4_10_14_0_8_um_filter_39_9]|uniref:Nudix hydrolase domain-containing protein n=1 Tax=Candidatus Roizmanbacteria bacterium CG_4_10_14_0_8_um_filter_39_9 TaxID=1974829 RepID=A0A2M7QD01_9BACT|nr:MAG: hypothetical protein COY90_02400 [Candidatus Roizmanbacteria bacterium CG_4_10_14_0_8_um_filter_39_9]
MPPKTFYIGIKGLIVKDNKVLVLKNMDQSGKYYWDIPGGRMGEGEEIQQTLNRELTEEILTIKGIHILDFVQVYKLPQNLKDGNGLMLLFYRVEAEIDTVEISDEHVDYRWVGVNDIESLNSNETYISDGYKKAIELALGI